MLSNPLQRFSPYSNLSSSPILSNSQGNVQANGLDSLGAGAPRPFQSLQPHVDGPAPHLAHPGSQQPKYRRPSNGAGGRASGTSGPVRRRISRACDQCNQLRTKCDGQHPCAHCLELGLGCEYVRERKKRGKASRKDLAQAQQAAAQAASGTDLDNDGLDGQGARKVGEPLEESSHPPLNVASQDSSDHSEEAPGPGAARGLQQSVLRPAQEADTATGLGGINGGPALMSQTDSDRNQLNNDPNPLDLQGYGSVSHDFGGHGIGAAVLSNERSYGSGSGNAPNYSDVSYGVHSRSPGNYGPGTSFHLGNSPMSGYPLPTGATPPGWGSLSIPSPSAHFQTQLQSTNAFSNQVRYPVLEPLLPHLGNLIPLTLACDLIDLYFSSSSSAKMHPMSPYVLGFVFRKQAFLHRTKPRRCQPALLASMLWVAAQTSDALFLTNMPSARGKVCQKLLELTVGLLNPLIHTSRDGQAAPSPAAEGVALGGLGVALPGTISMDALSGEFGAFGAAGNLDDLITYMHLATVVSASEYKGASLRWWNAAWSLARELKLGRELPSNDPMIPQEDLMSEGLDEHDIYRNTSSVVTEEEREERRRIWWLVYLADRHLALCYNRPLFLLDVECDRLKQPMDDSAWQAGDFSNFTASNTDPDVLGSISEEANGMSGQDLGRGPGYECRGHSIFGYFLPLMTILGEIVDLHHARNHPLFGAMFRSGQWDEQAVHMSHHLELYENSLRRFERQHLPKSPDHQVDGNNMADGNTPSGQSVYTNTSSRMTESDIQCRIVVAYGTHVMHVLHILLAGRWDPVNLLDDNDLWISTEGFITATDHAVAAAEAINQILEFDPGLEFMPFFFGVYLLQGSFLLLLIADKLQSEASPQVVQACETIVRAHEACVVTLSTEYQRNFSKVMRSALAQVRGRVPEDLGEQQQRRRELLRLYRWTADGTGLAL